MERRSLAAAAAVLSACVALAAGVIGGAFANRGGGSARSGATGPTGPHGWHDRGGPEADPAAFAVVQDVRKAIAAKAPDIAKPVLDKAVSNQEIPQAQADRLASLVADKGLSQSEAQALFSDPKAAPVFFEVKAAIAREAPGIATPIVDKAVGDNKLTRAQGDKLIAASAWRAEGFGLGRGPGAAERHRFGGPRRGFRRGP
jgi:hypothetical protein